MCEALCANVAQFPIQPSTQLLRDHTAFLYMRGDGPLLITLDAATLAVARGQTDVANQARPTANHLGKHRPERNPHRPSFTVRAG